MRPWVIYTLADPRSGDVRYVGQTHQKPKKRLQGHLSRARSGARYHLMTWIRSLLREGLEPSMTVVEEGEGDLWGITEKKWVAHYRNQGCDLTNSTEGGEGCPGHAVSAEAREKIRRARLGKPLSAEHRAKVAQGNRGKKMQPSSIAKTVAAHIGLKHTDEAKAKISAARKGRSIGKGVKPSPEVVEKRVAARRAAMVLRREQGVPPATISESHRRKISTANKGRKHTAEAKAKMSVSKKARDAKSAQGDRA